MGEATTADGKSAGKMRRLLDLLEDKRSLLIVMQDNPDPDCIASAAALRRLVNVLGEIQCSIAYGGVVGRAENKAMMDYLALNFRTADQVDPSKFDAIALVDTQPNAGNNFLPHGRLADIVIDHHPIRPDTRGVPFTDVRSKYGSTSTILHEYLTEAGIIPDPRLATALVYGILTDTQELGRKARQADREAMHWLYPLANTRMLSAIRRGRVTAHYYRMLHRALLGACVRGSGVHTDLGKVDNPDILGEVADMLLRLEDADWAMAIGLYRDTGWISLRTSQTNATARDLMRTLVDGLGTGGGHEMSAGGQVPGIEDATRWTAVAKKLRDRFLSGIGAGDQRGRRLIPAEKRKPE